MAQSPHPEPKPSESGPSPDRDEAKGTPQSDRHATETAAGRHEDLPHPEHKAT